jgi:hypothetical protein
MCISFTSGCSLAPLQTQEAGSFKPSPGEGRFWLCEDNLGSLRWRGRGGKPNDGESHLGGRELFVDGSCHP